VPLGQNQVRPRCTVARGPRPRRRLGPCARRGRMAHGHACAACARWAGLGQRGLQRRGAARRMPERSPLPGACHGAAGGDATAAETAQTTAVEHPRRWGYPPDMGDRTLAHRSSSSTLRRRNLAQRRRFSDEVGLRWPAVVLRR
jgi:hypothetical protein